MARHDDRLKRREPRDKPLQRGAVEVLPQGYRRSSSAHGYSLPQPAGTGG